MPPDVWDQVSADETSRIVRGTPRHACVLVVAGLDPSGGAGLIADASVVMQHGFHPAGVVTALTEQDSTQCAWMHPVEPEVVGNQLARLVDDIEIRGVKIGMLATPQLAQAVASALRRLADAQVPIVVDPVLRASRGVPLLEPGQGSALHALRPVLELATVVTPNLDELGALTGLEVSRLEDMREAAGRLLGAGASFGAQASAGGPHAVLAKGGHLDGDPVDLLVDHTGETAFSGPRVDFFDGGPAPHGTGCALSTELACRLAMATPLREAVRLATEHVRTRIAQARTIGRGRPFLG